MARPCGICVANHTSPIDVMILSCDNCYALVSVSLVLENLGLVKVLFRSAKNTAAYWESSNGP